MASDPCASAGRTESISIIWQGLCPIGTPFSSQKLRQFLSSGSEFAGSMEEDSEMLEKAGGYVGTCVRGCVGAWVRGCVGTCVRGCVGAAGEQRLLRIIGILSILAIALEKACCVSTGRFCPRRLFCVLCHFPFSRFSFSLWHFLRWP